MPDINTEAYLDSVGLKRHRNINQFWSYLDSRYSRERVGDLERAYIKLERGDEGTFYQEIFQELEVSIDFASLRYDLYSNYMSWFLSAVEKRPQPKAVIIDAGCGNGIVTCFYAKCFPESRVVGFDVSATGIGCAKELADQLGINNIEFFTADLNDLTLPIEKGTADIITSIASLTPPPGRHDSDISIYALLAEKPRLPDMIQIANLAPYLTPDKGLLFSFDKVSTIASQVSWANVIQHCGIGIDLTKSSWISYQNVEADTITLPVLVAGPGVKSVNADDLVSFFISRDQDFSGWILDFGQEALAETIFTFVNPKHFLRGGRAQYTDGSGVYFREIWQAGPFIIVFEHTDQGFRTLKVSPLLTKSDILREFEDWLAQTSEYAEIKDLSKPEINFGP